MDRLDQLSLLAERQHGVVARRQARALGLSEKALICEIERRWSAVTPTVVRLRGSPETDRQRAIAAVLDAGKTAVLSHHAAAALWEIPGYVLSELHVTRGRGRAYTPSRVAHVHLTRVLTDAHVAIYDGIPVTTPARTVFDLAALVHPYRLERTLDNAWSRRLLDGIQMARVLDDLGKRGRTGTTAIRELLKSRGADYVPPESGLEARFQDVLRRAGEPPMRRQENVGSDRWIGRMDFLDLELPVIVQVDSSRFHGSLLDQKLDAQQTAALEAAGFAVVRLTDHEVWYAADVILAKVRAARRKAVLARKSVPRGAESRARTRSRAA